jgi:hypothetical protein
MSADQHLVRGGCRTSTKTALMCGWPRVTWLARRRPTQKHSAPHHQAGGAVRCVRSQYAAATLARQLNSS